MTDQEIYTPHLPETLAPDSRVWIYQSDRPLTDSECRSIQFRLNHYVSDWKAHGKTIEGFASVFFNRFILILADETLHQVSGCSIDNSVRMLKEIEQELSITLFDRQLLCFWKEDQIKTIQLSEIEKAVQQGEISADSYYFNNTILSKREFEENWIIPMRDSWLSRYLPS
ncbi:MAG: hypothetical protein RIR96_564 [Bacteroidota bacterium]|jgi:hypothetical protein